MAKNISPFISEQFPAFYKEDGTFFIEFVKTYYQWLESVGNPLYHSRRLPEYIDVDTTSDDFLTHYREKYLPGFALLNETDKRTLVKHVLDIYRSKGSVRAIKLLFKLVYNDDVDVYWPGDDILRPSDGTFKRPIYLELSVSNKTSLFVGKEVTGQQTGARAIVESVSRRNINQTYIDVAQLTNVRGNFAYGELITADGLFEGAPRVVGSLSTLAVTSGGRNFTNGQLLSVVSDVAGYGGIAKVTATINQSGQVSYDLIDGGSGYSNTATVYVSERVLGYENLRTDSGFMILEPIEQPLVNVGFTSANNQYPIGSYVYGVDASNSYNTIAVAVVCSTTQNSTSFSTGNWVVSDRHAKHVAINTITSADPATGSFVVPSVVYQRAYPDTDSNTFVGYVYGANSTTLAIDVQYGTLTANVILRSALQPTTANVVSQTTYNQRFTNTSISDYRLVSANNALANLQIATASFSEVHDRTATSQYIGSNTGYIGLYNVSTLASYIPSTHAYIRGQYSNTYANATFLSSGNPGSFDIKTLVDTESVFLNTDEISANNTSNLPFAGLGINSTAYGFVKSPTANSSSLLINALTYQQFDIGTIASIGNINPGAYNTIDPIVLIRDKKVAGYGRRNYDIVYNNRNEFAFQTGEILEQSFTSNTVVITFSTLSGNTQFEVTGIGEGVKQVRSDGKVVYGTAINQNLSGTNKTITVSGVYATVNTSNLQPVNVTFDGSNSIVGVLSSANASGIISYVTTPVAYSTQGVVLSSNDTFIEVKRTRFANPNLTGTTVSGAVSGATADVTDTIPITTSFAYGENAIVTTQAGSATGVATEVDVVTSGFGYVPGETVTLISDENPYAITAIAGIVKEGQAAGFWQSTDGFLSSDKKIQDSNYYQEFSYEIQSSLSKEVYERRVKDTIHVAGTKLFGAVSSRQTIEVPTTLPLMNTVYEIAVSGDLQGNGYVVGAAVTDEYGNAVGEITDAVSTRSLVVNGTSNVVNGYITSFNTGSGISSNGKFASLNANTGVIAGKTLYFNSNTDIVSSVDLTFSTTDIVNAVSFTFNANTDVNDGDTLSFNAGDVITTAPSITINANTGINSGGTLTINPSSIVNAASFTFDASLDVNSSRRSFVGMTPAITSSFVATHSVTTSTSSGSKPATITRDYVPIVNANTYYSVGDNVQYNTDSSYILGTRQPLGGLTDGAQYVVAAANTTAIKLALPSSPTSPITMTLVYSTASSSHVITLLNGKSISGANSTITLSNANSYFAVGDPVVYGASTGNTLSIFPAGTYYVQFANTTVIALSNTNGGARIPLVTAAGSTYYVTSTTNLGGTIANPLGTSVSIGDSVAYNVLFANATPISPLVHRQYYYVQFANATHLALTNTSGGARIPIQSGAGAVHNLLIANSTTGYIASSTANTFNAGDRVTYAVATGNTAITLLQSGTTYYIKSSNNTHFSLTPSINGPIVPLRSGVNETGHTFVGASEVKSTTHKFTSGDIVQYVVASGNTAVANLTSNGVYYIKSVSSTGFSLSNAANGNAIILAHGNISEAGHSFVPMGANNTIELTSHNMIPGTTIKYRSTNVATPITGLTDNTVYYVAYANATHFALSTTLSNPTLTVAANTNFNVNDVVYQRSNGTTNTATATVTSVAGNTITVNINTMVGSFVPGSNVYSSNASPGNQTVNSVTTPQRISLSGGVRTPTNMHNIEQLGLKGTIATSSASLFSYGDVVFYSKAFNSNNITTVALVPESSYYVQFANSTHVSLTDNLIANTRAKLVKGGNEYHKIIRQTGNSSVIQTTLAAQLTAGDVVLYTRDVGAANLSNLTTNTTYYVQFANNTHIALATDPTGNRIELSQGLYSASNAYHFYARGLKGTILSTTATSFDVGDAVVYIANGTALTGLSNGSTYYVETSNSTYIALSSSVGGSRINIAKSSTIDGHSIVPVNKAMIQSNNSFSVGDVVKYTVANGNTALANFTHDNTYYIVSANASHFALSTSAGGPRIDMISGRTELGHFFSSTGAAGAIATANAGYFVVGDRVIYTRAVGNTSSIGLTANTTYYVEFANSTHIGLSTSSDGYRVPVYSNAHSEAGHYLSTVGEHSLIVANNEFVVGDAVVYTTSNTNITGLSNNTTYYVEFANATHFTLSSSLGGSRQTINHTSSSPSVQTFTEAGINTISVVTTVKTPSANVAFHPGGHIRLYPGNTNPLTIVSVNVTT